MPWFTEIQVKYQFCKVLLDNRNVPKYNSYGKKHIFENKKKTSVNYNKICSEHKCPIHNCIELLII